MSRADLVAERLVRAEAWSFLRRDRSRASTCRKEVFGVRRPEIFQVGLANAC